MEPEWQGDHSQDPFYPYSFCWIEIEKHKTNKYLQKYKKVLRDALEKYIDYDEDVMGVLKEQNGAHYYSSYGDYYMIESYMKENSDITVW